jgi:hypothetical protein
VVEEVPSKCKEEEVVVPYKLEEVRLLWVMAAEVSLVVAVAAAVNLQ